MFSYKMFMYLVLTIIIFFIIYNSCDSHDYIQYRNTWEMSRKDRVEYKKKRFCSVPLWFLVLVAITITFTFNVNPYTTYATVLLFVLYLIFIYF